MTLILRCLQYLYRALAVCGAGEPAAAVEEEAPDVEFDIDNEEGTNLFGLDPNDETPPGKEIPEEDQPKPAKAKKPKAEAEAHEDDEDDDVEPDLDAIEDEDDDEQEADEDEDEEQAELETEAVAEDDVREAVERWDWRLERSHEAGEFRRPVPNVQLADIEPSEKAMKAFREALAAEGEDDAQQAKAVAALVRDMVGQGLARYYHGAHVPEVEKQEKAAAQRDVDTRLSKFLETPEGKVFEKDKALKDKMAQRFDAIQEKYGWRAALKPSWLDYYKMAGGPKVKAGKAPKAKVEEEEVEDEDEAPRARPKSPPSKAAALAAAGGPKKTRSTGRKTGVKAPRLSDEEAFLQSVQSDEDLFGIE